MAASLGRITAKLAEPSEEFSPDLVDLINQNINPPEPVGPDDVHIRAMYVVSDQVNSFGGRFPSDEHARLAALLVDSPVMVGHRKDKLPIGRNFSAETVERNGHSWIKNYFYWLCSADGADSLRENIDGGIYKECSIAFTFLSPECSICGKDIRRCVHEPNEHYDIEGQQQRCYFNYRKIERVLETSLVYRGAVPYTSVSKKLQEEEHSEPGATVSKYIRPTTRLHNLDELDKNGRYLVVPRYEGVPLIGRSSEGRMELSHLDGSSLAIDLCPNFESSDSFEQESLYGMLVGYRGKERCSKDLVKKYLANRTGPVSRLVFNIYPQPGAPVITAASQKSEFDIRVIPHRTVMFSDLERKAREIMTRLGIEIWPADENLMNTTGWFYIPDQHQIKEEDSYSLEFNETSSEAVLSISADDRQERFKILHFDIDRLHGGRRFVADRMDNPSRGVASQGSSAFVGTVESLHRDKEAVVSVFEGSLSGMFILRPVKLNGRDRFVLYKRNCRANNGEQGCDREG